MNLKVLHRTFAMAVLLLGSCSSVVAQSPIPSEYRGETKQIARGVLDGNLIETNFRNHGEVSRWNDIPWGIWPRGIGNRHVDGLAMVVAGGVNAERTKWSQFYPNATRDTTVYAVIINYREAGKRLGPDGNIWGWLPIPGFHNPVRVDPVTNQLTPTPALSDDPTSWPDFWPDRLDFAESGWRGSWNGLFGRGVFNADLESYYVMDDNGDYEYRIDPVTGTPSSPYGVFYPSASDSTRGGLGMQTQVRILQWANVLAEDTMFILYRINNVGETNHDKLFFTQLCDYGLGWEEGDENAAFNPVLDIAYGWDQDGIGTNATGGTYQLGYTGFAFLESPARAFDLQDNDQDGFIDESRFGGPGTLLEGKAQIDLYLASNYNLVDFENFYGQLELRPAYRAERWWTGDENLDWVGFEDRNGNGVWDVGENINNDVGRDGLGPFDLGYLGPDDGEADGVPSVGEPNFDLLDVDESDQIGLTGFDLNTRPFYESGSNLQSDTWLWDRIDLAQFPLGTPAADFVADVEPFLLFTSGPVALPPQTTDFFSMAWLFGNNEQDFFKNRKTVQNIYNADYNFAQPPFAPTLTAVPGDGRVVLSWDTLAVSSFDRFSQEFDFEGFRLYKGTDPLLSDSREITDVNGNPLFYKPLKQWDLKNGIKGNTTVFDGEAVYHLGDDTGLSFFYIDEDVKNGLTYYYALVAYDRGFIDSTSTTAPPIDPQENTFNVSVDQAGNLVGLSRNAAIVTPRAEPAGFVSGRANEDLSKVSSGIGTGSASVRVISDQLVKPDHVYQVSFFDSLRSNIDLYDTVDYMVRDATDNTTLIARTRLVETTPLVDGFVVEFDNDEQVSYLTEKTGYVANANSANEMFSLDPTELDGYSTNWVASVRRDTTTALRLAHYDYELVWVNDSLYTPPRFGLYPRIGIPVFAINKTRSTQADLLIQDNNRNAAFDAGDELIISERVGVTRVFRHRVKFVAKDGGTSVPPSVGNRLRISNRRPFATGDAFQFTVSSSSIDTDAAGSELEQIAVVPNPYVAAAEWERRSQIVGRGERRIQFINLPLTCTIRIYNIRGELINTLEHNGVGSDGALFWDLKTTGGQDLVYGVYIYHVEAPGVGEHTGKFAVVK